MYDRILAALKQDESDSAVLQHAGYLASLTRGQLTLAHVVHSHSRDQAAYLEGQADEYLQRCAQQVEAQGLSVSRRVVVGELAEAIGSLARELGSDLIVMATHAHSEARHLFVGSVTEGVLREGETTVLLVRPGRAPVD